MATEYNNPQLTKCQKDIIGTWIVVNPCIL